MQEGPYTASTLRAGCLCWQWRPDCLQRLESHVEVGSVRTATVTSVTYYIIGLPRILQARFAAHLRITSALLWPLLISFALWWCC